MCANNSSALTGSAQRLLCTKILDGNPSFSGLAWRGVSALAVDFVRALLQVCTLPTAAAVVVPGDVTVTVSVPGPYRDGRRLPRRRGRPCERRCATRGCASPWMAQEPLSS